MNHNENLAPSVIQRLMKDIRSLSKNSPEGIKVHFCEENIANITADIEGPVGTPFEGGLFKVRLILPSDFPHTPPKGVFLTKIFHPNVSEIGEICVNTLKKDWKPTHGIEHVLLIIRCLLIVPNETSALNPEAGRLLLEDYEDFASRARIMTRIHAKAPKEAEGVEASSSSSSSSKSKSKSKTDKAKADKKKAKKKTLRRL